MTYEIKEKLQEDVRIAGSKCLIALGAAIIQGFIFFCITMLTTFLYIGIIKYLTLPHPSIFNILVQLSLALVYLVAIVYLYFIFYFYMPLILLENAGIISSLQFSATLVYRHWGRVFKLQIIPWITYFIIMLLLQTIFKIDLNLYFINYDNNTLPALFIHIIVIAILIPWMAALLILQVHDLLLRKKITL